MSVSFRSGLSAVALAACAAGPALAGPTYTSASGGTFTYYGQLSPSYLSVDDGVDTQGDLVDNVHSNSRVGFYLRQPFGANTFQFRFETALGLKASNKVGQTSDPSNLDWDRTNLRHVDFSLSGAFGTVSAGQGSMASDNIATMDLSGTTLVMGQSVTDAAGAYQFTTSGGALSGIKLSDAFASYDGGRKGRIRYDTPSLNGFVLSASYGTEILASGNDDEYYDITVRYEKEFGEYTVNGGLGVAWTDKQTGTDTRDTVASVSLEHSSGLNGTLSYGDRDTSGDYIYGKVGYKMKVFAIGSTAMSLDYYSGNDLVSTGSESEAWGVGVVQKVDAYNVELYASYRNYSLDDNSGTDYNDLSAVLVGARWKF